MQFEKGKFFYYFTSSNALKLSLKIASFNNLAPIQVLDGWLKCPQLLEDAKLALSYTEIKVLFHCWPFYKTQSRITETI